MTSLELPEMKTFFNLGVVFESLTFMGINCIHHNHSKLLLI